MEIRLLVGPGSAPIWRVITTGDDLIEILGEGYEEVTLPEVSLSRKWGKCYFTLDNLKEHDGHAPAFTSTEDEMEYVLRILKEMLNGIGVTDDTLTTSESLYEYIHNAQKGQGGDTPYILIGT